MKPLTHWDGESAKHSYVMLKIGGMQLMLPRLQLRTLEPAADLLRAEAPACGVGWLHFQGVPWPAFCFDEDLFPMSAMPGSARICALFAGHSCAMAIVCDEFVGHMDAGWQFEALSPCMPLPDCPILRLAHRQGRIAVVSDCDAIGDFLSARYGTELKLQILRNDLNETTLAGPYHLHTEAARPLVH